MTDFMASMLDPVWNTLSPVDKNTIVHNVTTKTLQGGQLLHRGDEDCSGLVMVKSGQLRVYMLSEEGREITLYRLYTGEICTLSSSCVLEESGRNQMDILHLTHEDIARLMGSAREVVSKMMKYFEREGLVEYTRGKIRISDRKKLIKMCMP